MGFFSSIFSSDDAISKTTDAVISAGDKLFYTDEEKADMKQKLMSYHLESLKFYEPFKLAQRYLAIGLLFLFGSAFLMGLGYIYNDLDTKPILDLVEAFSIHYLVGIVFTFYFMGGTIESFKKAK